MSTSLLQAPFELLHYDYDYRNTFEASSPPSSIYAVDSSPPSSPVNDAYIIDASDDDLGVDRADRVVDESPSPDASPSSIRRIDAKGKGTLATELDASPAHPFSASTRAVKRPPSYSKDTTRPKIKRPRNEVDADCDVYGIPHRLHERDDYIQSIVPKMHVTAEDHEIDGSLVSPSQDPEHDLWEETLAQAVDAVECKIDLSGHMLTYIPPKIADLSKLVVFRDSSASARELVPRRTVSKSTNSIVFGARGLGHREDEIHLFLGKNNIAALPNELFNLDALVVLSLRGNCLTEIPPLICQLRNLRELNVANNKLRFLPSEILSLKLNSLAVDPNPFEENPYAKSDPAKDRWFGPVGRRHAVVPLAELALRVLLAPSSELYGVQFPTLTISDARRQETVLEHCYDLPIQSDYVISPDLRETLSSCVPGSIASTQSSNAVPHASPDIVRPGARLKQRPCMSVCPSPHHLDTRNGKYRLPVLVSHVEERLSWEEYIAGQRVGGEKGIPVRWRGCSIGCLVDLEQPNKDVSTIGAKGEENWSTRMEIDGKGSNIDDADIGADGGTPTFTLARPASKSDFKEFDSADIDLDD